MSSEQPDDETRLLVSPLILIVVLGLLVPMLAVAWLNVQGPRECRERPEVLQ